MKLKEIFRETIRELLPVYSEREAGSIARLLIEDLGYEQGPLSISWDKDIPSAHIDRLRYYKTKLLRHEPVQYILGYAWFYDKKFRVGPSCLIPRQETELLVHLILEKEGPGFIGKLLDIATGSGCIAVSIALHRPAADIYASDLSDEALETAKLNASDHNVKVSFISDNILEPEMNLYPGELDIIVSNPPYVRNSEKIMMEKNVLDFEPPTALFVSDDDPLVFYRAIARTAAKILKPGGRIYLEINEYLGNETAVLLENFGFSDIEIHKDLQDKNRIISARYEK